MYDWLGTVNLQQEMGEVWGLKLTIQRAPKGPSQGSSPSKKVLRVMSIPPTNTLQLPCLREKAKSFQWSVRPLSLL